MKDLGEKLFPYEEEVPTNPNYHPQSVPLEELLIEIPGTIVHLIDKQKSIELTTGDLTFVRLRQGKTWLRSLLASATRERDGKRDEGGGRFREMQRGYRRQKMKMSRAKMKKKNIGNSEQ